MVEWFNKHRKESVAGSQAQKLVPFVENELHDQCQVASHLLVNELNTFYLEYIVIGRDGKTYLVDLLKKNCSCKCFDIDMYHCVHAIVTTMTLMKQEWRTTDIHLHDLCSRYYLMERWVLAYYKTIYLVPHKSERIIPDHIPELWALPPNYTKTKGRIQETRFPSVGDHRRRVSNKSVSGRNLGSWFRSHSSSEG